MIAAASSDAKLEVCREHGADLLINYSNEDLREAVKAATGGKGPDVIYDPVGGAFAEPAFPIRCPNILGTANGFFGPVVNVVANRLSRL